MQQIILCIACLVIFCAMPFLPSQVQAKTVTDELGRELELPEKIDRVVSLAPSITESIFCIDQGHKLVGVTKYSDYPEQAQNIPSVGSYINLNVERIISLQPDLCLATKDGNPYQAIQQLERAGIPVFALDPRDLPAIMDTIEKLGQLLGVVERAEQVVAGMRQKLHELQDIVSRADTKPRVFFQIGISPIVSVGKDTFIHELITLAGGVNIAAADIQYPRYSREDVLIFNPDIILINSMSNEQELVQAEITTWRDFPRIDAVRTGRIYPLDAALFNRPTPRLTKALEILVRLFHPECADELGNFGWSAMRPGPDDG